MDAADLIDLRAALRISQLTMANRIGVSLRAFKNIESGKTKLTRLHELAIERVVIGYAIDRNDPGLLGELRSRMTNLIMFEFSARVGSSVAAREVYRSKRLKTELRASDVRNF